MADDKQQQHDELLILKSILGDAVTVLGNDNDQFEIDIDLQLPSPFHLRLIDSSTQLTTPIRYLPPLVLTVHFHDAYPSSTESPTLVLSSCYLSRQCLQHMCHTLDQIWEQNISEPIVFQWVECLKDIFVSKKELCLLTSETSDEEDDPRAMSSYDPDQAARVYEQILEYNREKEQEIFLRGYHECPICLTADVPGREMLRLHKCQHAFCLGCLGDYAKVNIDTGRVEWLLCPDGQCQLALLPTEVKAIFHDRQLYEKYERLLLQKTLEKMLDIVWCPRFVLLLVYDHFVLMGLF